MNPYDYSLIPYGAPNRRSAFPVLATAPTSIGRRSTVPLHTTESITCLGDRHKTLKALQADPHYKAYKLSKTFTVHVAHPIARVDIGTIKEYDDKEAFPNLVREFKEDVKRWVRKDEMKKADIVWKSLNRIKDFAETNFGEAITIGRSPKETKKKLEEEREKRRREERREKEERVESPRRRDRGRDRERSRSRSRRRGDSRRRGGRYDQD